VWGWSFGGMSDWSAVGGEHEVDDLNSISFGLWGGQPIR
jgi:hypothetical protein